MCKKLGLLAGIFLMVVRLSAQLPSGATAPDFVAQDIYGQTHHLYDILESGKIVLIEISATWCAPCWVYHTSQALQDLYAEHGPQGDDKLRVFWVEGDPSTNINCIFGEPGCNGGTAGNYTQGVDYPILDNAAIANAFQISYYPSLFVICPNKRVYEVEPLGPEDLWEKANQCPVAYGNTNAGIFEYYSGTQLDEICGFQEIAPNFLLTNLGSSPLTQATIELSWNNNTVQTLSWTGNLYTYGEANIQFAPLTVSNSGTLSVNVSGINNGAGDEDLANNVRSDNFSQAKSFNTTQVVLKLRTDNFGEETYWEVRDDWGSVLEFGGNQEVGPNGGGAFPLGVLPGPGAYPSLTIIRDTLDLPANGCYSLHISDGYGDGMCCNFGSGYYRLYNLNDPTTPIISGGEFDNYDRRAFGAGVLTSTDSPAELQQLALFPNPASTELYIELETPEVIPVSFRIYNAYGQLFWTLEEPSAARGLWQAPTVDWPAGVYFLQASAGNQRTVRVFMVEK
ncbi:MAG TPA: T9SS type A sorting domain-containing protein [Saprospiraceae bacterium]|nr:T9SS type A sorting domain-containing protein [Saprospiraceae bacterium]